MSLVKFQLTQSENAFFFFLCCLFVFSRSRFCRPHIFTAASAASGLRRKGQSERRCEAEHGQPTLIEAQVQLDRGGVGAAGPNPTLEGNLIVDFNAEKNPPAEVASCSPTAVDTITF